MTTPTPSGDGSPPGSSDLVPPSYPEMIVAAIAALAEENGSSQAAIARRIEAQARGDLPASHPALVAAHLSRMSAAGELVAVAGGKYALPPPPAQPAPESPADDGEDDDDDDDCADEVDEEEEAPEPLLVPVPVPQPPAKRGRGRPPKPRPAGFPIGVPGAAASPAAAPRRRGRPPKPRDPHAPPKIPRPRGRPRKNPLPEGMAPRPRPGAPASAKAARPQFAEVGFV
ncbi:HMG-Y-related protein A [Zea mays]|uniref:H15 domain-containing protein n=2 Tax=Zea mays TaxID=4577 RepID=A0A804P8Q9_MAIZE|nr:HMG-Y-related protein A [Zea mays]